VRFVKWPQERKVIEVGDAVIANEKIKENIGWHPVVTLENGLEQTKKYYASRLKYYLK
jgi:UDP-glucose 4-epimerase